MRPTGRDKVRKAFFVIAKRNLVAAYGQVLLQCTMKDVQKFVLRTGCLHLRALSIWPDKMIRRIRGLGVKLWLMAARIGDDLAMTEGDLEPRRGLSQ